MRTLLLIKPNALSNIGSILKILQEENFFICKLKMMKMDEKLANKFYEIHKGKNFIESLVEFMCSDNIVAVALEKENAVDSLRETIGNTDPAKAKKGSIRALFGKSIGENAVHASDSEENAKKEISIIFS